MTFGLGRRQGGRSVSPQVGFPSWVRVNSLTTLSSSLLQRQLEWWADQLGPVVDRVRQLGYARSAPASLLMVMTSLTITAVALGTGSQHHAANHALSYRGSDFYHGDWWKLITSGLLAQSWLQFLWTALIAVVVFAPLEVRVGPGTLIAATFLPQIISTVVVAIGAPLLDHSDELTRPDFGTSCLVVGAAAALAWVRRSRLLTVVIVVSLAVDSVLSASATAVEHCVAVATGALVMMWATPDPRPRIARRWATRISTRPGASLTFSEGT
jgi:membrane associated rhomboid family serine protease